MMSQLLLRENGGKAFTTCQGSLRIHHFGPKLTSAPLLLGSLGQCCRSGQQEKILIVWGHTQTSCFALGSNFLISKIRGLVNCYQNPPPSLILGSEQTFLPTACLTVSWISCGDVRGRDKQWMAAPGCMLFFCTAESGSVPFPASIASSSGKDFSSVSQDRVKENKQAKGHLQWPRKQLQGLVSTVLGTRTCRPKPAGSKPFFVSI